MFVGKNAKAQQSHSTNYQSALITVSPDTKATTSTVPAKPGAVATLQYELLAKAPYKFTSDDVLFLVHAQRTQIKPTPAARAAFFSKPQACLRTSPLARIYGFGIVHDKAGRIALAPVDSKKYQELLTNPAVRKLPAMRRSRAPS